MTPKSDQRCQSRGSGDPHLTSPAARERNRAGSHAPQRFGTRVFRRACCAGERGRTRRKGSARGCFASPAARESGVTRVAKVRHEGVSPRPLRGRAGSHATQRFGTRVFRRARCAGERGRTRRKGSARGCFAAPAARESGVTRVAKVRHEGVSPRPPAGEEQLQAKQERG
jgi:hypothetical protein